MGCVVQWQWWDEIALDLLHAVVNSLYASYAEVTTYWNGHILLREVLQKDHGCTQCTNVAGDENYSFFYLSYLNVSTVFILILIFYNILIKL